MRLRMKLPSLDKNAVAYASVAFANAMMNPLFNFYYVKLFLNSYKISEVWFNQAQVIYMIWNAINDPLFGYFQDNSSLACFRQRRTSILYGAPLFALSFLIPWFPWGQYEPDDWLIGLHLIVALNMYDTLFTFVLLQHCALFTEVSRRHEDRVQLMRYCQVAGLLGTGPTIGIASAVSNYMENLHNFRIFTLLVAALAWASMHYAALHIRTELDHTRDQAFLEAESQPKDDGNSSSFWKLTWQIVTQKNFVLFITTLLLSPVVEQVGSYRVILASFYLELVCAVGMFLAGPQPWLVVLYLLMDMSIPGAIFNLFNISVSDIIDADCKKYARKTPLSSMFFGMNALFTKPAQSLAPMLVVSILNRYGYEDLVRSTTGLGTSTAGHDELRQVMFHIFCLLPATIAFLQILVWKPYSLKDSHASTAKHIDT
ncbi:PREDICTED: transmembrane protein 180-like [Branchiostoma belcheri]|uniref:Transmembrane protein 180-like n=1 Tax=Branchiostoma belcheri TaxID=7741 RepID=A0A6P4Y9P7_BRABE|nr:PREDICTED: transmembrane protein 180-like [Branchiostoma belcheri]